MRSERELELESAVEDLACDVKNLRRLLWLRHNSGHMLYGDDGEMQCNTCGMDFKHMSVSDIENTFFRQALLEMAKPEVRDKINALMFTLDKSPITFKESTSGKEV